MKSELLKQLRRLRTWVAFAGLMALPIIATVASKLNPDDESGGIERTIYLVSTHSGLNNALAALAFMAPFFLVIVSCTFAGESIAGEANWGTLRYLLIRPIPRPRLLWRKGVTVAVMTTLATLVVVVTALVAGTIAFGWHPAATPFLTEIPAGEASARLLLSTAYVVWSLMAIVSFSFMISTMTDVAGGAIGAAISLAIGSQILDGLNAIGAVRSVLPTHYWSAWAELFLPGGSGADMVRGALLSLAYVVVFGAIALWWFRRKDILS